MNIQSLIATVCCLPTLLAQSSLPAQTFQSKSVSYHGTIRLSGPIEKVFPLFTPEGEKNWADGWDPEYVNPPNGITRQGMVFRTSHSGPLLWVMSRYDPQQHEIAYVVTGTGAARLIQIKCHSEGADTVAEVTNSYVSISEDGNEFVSHHTTEDLGKHIEQWKTAIDNFLKGGK